MRSWAPIPPFTPKQPGTFEYEQSWSIGVDWHHITVMSLSSYLHTSSLLTLFFPTVCHSFSITFTVMSFPSFFLNTCYSFSLSGLILHFAAAISLKYHLSCINHWPILAPIRSAISHRGRTKVLEDRLSAGGWCFYNSPKKANQPVLINIQLSHTFSKSYNGRFHISSDRGTRWNTHFHELNDSYVNCDWLICCAAARWKCLIERPRPFDDGNMNVKT